ncbi:probable 18S rRNA (guanine-N(7))-methyltransferase isoform X3 [Phasianus colchicus]|uniref:probable 18S rRNA (guanine-N(7))-methyltransferase isoform X3 n=1 Tax=Phasianus colchicus TaxID=9054 RepID=UPI00129EB274|nr:probable 18S rRNA (guanine-N(7))-methyltransferase isoform X3 [Phasianus colchicus]
MAGSGRRPEHRGPPELLPRGRDPGADGGAGRGAAGAARGTAVPPPGRGLRLRTERGAHLRGGTLLDRGGHQPRHAGISAVQWLCNADKKSHSPPKRLYRFFSTLYTALARGSRAVLQLYPENSEQLELITAQAMRAGFTGGMVVDYPNSAKAKKFFLCLFVGASGTLPKGLGTECADGEEIHQAKFTNERIRFRNAKGKSVKKSRDWILEKKERRRRQGKEVRADTKYTGRKRRPQF